MSAISIAIDSSTVRRFVRHFLNLNGEVLCKSFV
jgi:hypothetical protein